MKQIVAGTILILISIAVSLAVRFSNPDLTETQLFLKYWPVWICATLLAGAGGFIAGRKSIR